MQRKMSEKIHARKNAIKIDHAQDGPHFDINDNSSRKMFQNAPNGIRACLDRYIKNELFCNGHQGSRDGGAFCSRYLRKTISSQHPPKHR